MPPNIEAQAEVILTYIITPEEKAQAAKDVTAEDESKWNRSRLSVRLQDDPEIVDELSKSGIRRAVGLLYGVADQTVRNGERAARLFPPGLVRAHPLLTFSYWLACADANHLDSQLESALDIVWQIENETEMRGKRPSVNTVWGWVYKDDNEKIRSVWRGRSESIVDQLDKIQNDSYAPEDVRIFVGWVRAMLLSLLETGASPLQDSPVTVQNPNPKEVSPTN